MNIKIDIHKQNFENARNIVKKWNVQEPVKKSMFDFLEQLSLGQVNKGKKISDATRIKYIYLLRIPLEFINKPINKINKSDIERFEKEISSGNLKNFKDKAFAHTVLVDIRIALRTFIKWAVGREKGDQLTDWLDTRDIKKTPDYLKESEIELLYKSCKSLSEMYLIAVLFDSGARAEEFHNIRFEDIELPTGNDNYVKIALKEEYSKTEGRTISLYWKHSLEAVRDYLEERKRQGVRANEPIYDLTYDAMRFFLMRLGKRVLGRNINPHLFRHSSATYYASQMNRHQLCMRYGWKFSSNMPDTYISRAGMNNKELDEKFSGTEINVLKNELEKQKQISNIEMDKLRQKQLIIEEALKRLVPYPVTVFDPKQQNPIDYSASGLSVNGMFTQFTSYQPQKKKTGDLDL